MIFGNMRVRMQSLQFVAPRCQGIEKTRLLEQVCGLEVSILLRERRQIHKNFVHAAVFGAQHPLALIGADAARKNPPPIGPCPRRFQARRCSRSGHTCRAGRP